jgi:prevent-host-death family protein
MSLVHLQPSLSVAAPINVHDAKTHFSKLLDLAHAGQEVILAKAGKPYARLMPLANAKRKRTPGRLNGQVEAAFFEPLPEQEMKLWNGQ